MIPYGSKKRHHKLHPHNKCKICAENKISRKRERQLSKKMTDNQIRTTAMYHHWISFKDKPDMIVNFKSSNYIEEEIGLMTEAFEIWYPNKKETFRFQDILNLMIFRDEELIAVIDSNKKIIWQKSS